MNSQLNWWLLLCAGPTSVQTRLGCLCDHLFASHHSWSGLNCNNDHLVSLQVKPCFKLAGPLCSSSLLSAAHRSPHRHIPCPWEHGAPSTYHHYHRHSWGQSVRYQQIGPHQTPANARTHMCLCNAQCPTFELLH